MFGANLINLFIYIFVELLGMKMIICLHINHLHGTYQHQKEVLMMIQLELQGLLQLISTTNGTVIVPLEPHLNLEKVKLNNILMIDLKFINFSFCYCIITI